MSAVDRGFRTAFFGGPDRGSNRSQAISSRVFFIFFRCAVLSAHSRPIILPIFLHDALSLSQCFSSLRDSNCCWHVFPRLTGICGPTQRLGKGIAYASEGLLWSMSLMMPAAFCISRS